MAGRPSWQVTVDVPQVLAVALYIRDVAGVTQTSAPIAEATWTRTFDLRSIGCATVTDPLGRTTSYTYDADGNRRSALDALGRTASWTHDDAGRVTSMTRPDGSLVEYTYDAGGNLNSVAEHVNNDIAGTSYTHDEGLLVAVEDPTGRRSTYDNDAAGLVSVVTDPAGGQTAYTRDAVGRVIARTDPAGESWVSERDDTGRVIRTVDPTGVESTFGHAADGRLLAITAPSTGATTRFAYDRADRLSSTTLPDGGVELIGRDPAGNPVAITGADGGTTTYAWSPRHEEIAATDPLGNTVTTAYDAVGNPILRTDALGRTTTLRWDAADQLVTVDRAGGGADVTYSYDQVGRRTSMIDATGSTAYTYDAAGRVLSQESAAGQLSYTYDLAGRLQTMTYPGGHVVSYTYDAAGRPASTTDWTGATNTVAHDDRGQLATALHPNGVTDTFDTDAAGRPTGISFDGANDVSLAYDYDQRGLLATEAITGSAGRQTIDFAHDALGRLTRAGEETYTYDAVGNRTQIGDIAAAYDVGRQLCALGRLPLECGAIDAEVTFTHDAAGNRTGAAAGDASTTNTYDAADRLTATEFLQPLPDSVDAEVQVQLTRSQGAGWQGTLRLSADGFRQTTPIGCDACVEIDGRDVTATLAVDGGDIELQITTDEQTGDQSITVIHPDPAVPVVDGPAANPIEVSDMPRPSIRGRTDVAATTDRSVRERLTYTYDADGSLASRQRGDDAADTFIWDRAAGATSMVVAGDDRIIRMPDGMPIAVLRPDGQGGWLRTSVHLDRSGSAVATGDIAGELSMTRFDAVGREVGSSLDIPIGWAGSYLDPDTGLSLHGIRWYDPTTTTFLTQDPLAWLSTDPYGYGWQSPTAFTDRSGAWPLPAITGAIGGAVGAAAGAVSYGVKVATTDESFSIREFGADVAGGAAGGAVAGACTGASLNVVACGAAAGATSNLVRTAISGTQTFDPGGLAVETVVAGATAGLSNLAINRIPALSGLRINPGWFRPSQVSNLWNPGPYVRRLYTSEGLGAALGLITGGLSSFAYGRLSAGQC